MILLINTAQLYATVALAEEGKVLISEDNNNPKEHATWLHPAIGRIIAKAKISFRDLKAVAVVAGPGSYTGLRVGMAAAKGFCYALKIPLITRGTLRLMAESMAWLAESIKVSLICPLIDARRDEVFTALYRLNTVTGHQSSVIELEEILPPQALILDKNSFEKQLADNYVIFFGSGADKWARFNETEHVVIMMQPDATEAFATLSQRDFVAGNWADPVYAEPVYLKEFFSY